MTGRHGGVRSLPWQCVPAAAALQGCSNTGAAVPPQETSNLDHQACWQVWGLGAALGRGQHLPGGSCDHLWASCCCMPGFATMGVVYR